MGTAIDAEALELPGDPRSAAAGDMAFERLQLGLYLVLRSESECHLASRPDVGSDGICQGMGIRQ